MRAEEKKHIYLSKHAVGCIPCLLGGWANTHPDYHHVIDGNVRYGHLIGFPMCLWHHRGQTDWADTMSFEERIERMGPSYELHRKRFLEEYGTEMELVNLNNYIIKLWSEEPWLEHDMSVETMNKIREHYRQRTLI